jgi:hypothetical protein
MCLMGVTVTACGGGSLDSSDGGPPSAPFDGGVDDAGEAGRDAGPAGDAGFTNDDAGSLPTDGGHETPPDAGEPPDPPAPECTIDDDCAAGRGCHEGICRWPCVLGGCALTEEDDVCSGGFCVDCVDEDGCPGARTTCDLEHHQCVPQQVDTSGTRFGIFYSLWHCPFAADNPDGDAVHDISEVLAGQQSWGPLLAFHWWDEPEAGYYCLSRNDALLAEHAARIQAAGIEFIFFDATNHAYVDWRSDRTPEMILEPLDRLLAVWSAIPGAPRVVPWVPIVEAGTNAAVNTIDAIVARLDAYPDMYFEHDGAPLILVTENDFFTTSEAKVAALEERFTVRRMWAHENEDGPMWSFMEGCHTGLDSLDPCEQRVATHDGAIEQLAISTAYQLTYMSVPEYAVPKHGGRTFRRQFQTLFDNPETPIATITGWNEWIAQRTPCGQHPTCPCASFPDGCFLDQYDIEYSRDIEPGQNERGDFYYDLLTSCIDLYRTGWMCDETNASELCCSAEGE